MGETTISLQQRDFSEQQYQQTTITMVTPDTYRETHTIMLFSVFCKRVQRYNINALPRVYILLSLSTSQETFQTPIFPLNLQF